MKNATPRNSASPPSHANNFTPMNCSQLMAGSTLRGGAGAGLGGGAVCAKTGGGTTTGGGCGGMMVGFGVGSGTGGTIFGCGYGAGVGGAGAFTGAIPGVD